MLEVSDYKLENQVEIEVKQRSSYENWGMAYKRWVMSVAGSRRKVTMDDIKPEVNGVFPSYNSLKLGPCSLNESYEFVKTFL